MRLCSITLLVTLYVFTNFAHSEEVELAPISVKASAFDNQSSDQFAQSVDVIAGDELDDKKAVSIGETLKDELGVSSTFFSQGASRPIIRGLGTNRVRVLENGIDSLDASSVSEDHPVSIEPFTAEQVEIIRGPSTLRFGPGAIGGVVNVVNKRLPQSLIDKPLDLKFTQEHNSVSDGNTTSIDLNGSLGSFAWHVDGLVRNTNDYDIDGFANEDEQENRGDQPNSDVETDSYGFGGSYIGDKGLFGLAFSRLDSNYGVPSIEEGDIRIDSRQYRYDNLIELYDLSANVESITWRSTYNNYRHFEIEGSGEIATTFDNEEFESRLEGVFKFSENTSTAIGIQYNDRDFSAVGEEAFVAPLDQKRFGIFAINKLELTSWELELGARFDRDELDPDEGSDEDFSILAVSLGAIKFFDNDVQLNLFGAVTERAPQEVALFADGPHLATATFEVGDTDIDEETSFNFEVGLSQAREDYGWQVNSYVNYIDDYIFVESADENGDGIADRTDEEGEFELDGELLFGSYTNESAIFYGIEGEFTKSLYTSDVASIDGRVFGDYIRAEFTDNEFGDVPRIPPARIGFGLEFGLNEWNADIDAIYNFEQNNTADLEESTDDFTMVNASLSRTFSLDDTDLRLFVLGENLLDEDARRHSSFQTENVVLPGRGIRLGISLDY